MFKFLFALLFCTSALATDGRLSVAANDPVPEGDITTSSLYLGTLTMTLSSAHLAGKNYDVFETASGLCSGPAWTNNTTRSADVQASGGEVVNSASMVCTNGSTTSTVAAFDGKLRGGFRSHVNGQTRSTRQSRLVWDARYPQWLPVRQIETASTWSYGSAVFRQVNGSAINQIEVFNGFSGRMVNITASAYMIGSSLTAGFVGIGLDSSVADSSHMTNPCAGGNTFPVLPCWAHYKDMPGIGYHEFRWLERGTGVGITWVGLYSGYTGYGYKAGLVGEVWQ